MMVGRARLIKVVRDEITRRENAVVARNERAQAQCRQAEQEYVDRTAMAWEELASMILTVNNMRRALTPEDIPQALLGDRRGVVHSIPLFTPRRTDTDVANVAQLRLLVEVLETSDDEYVSTSSLQKEGFTLGKVLSGR
jgi:hypothetical protein